MFIRNNVPVGTLFGGLPPPPVRKRGGRHKTAEEDQLPWGDRDEGRRVGLVTRCGFAPAPATGATPSVEISHGRGEASPETSTEMGAGRRNHEIRTIETLYGTGQATTLEQSTSWKNWETL